MGDVNHDPGRRFVGPSEDYLHPFHGFGQPGGLCRVRIYRPDDGPPIVVATALKDQTRTPLAYICEILAAELLVQHFPHRAGEAQPMVYLQHHPATYFCTGERVVQQVTFATMRPRRICMHDRWRWTFDQPTWRTLADDEVVTLLGSLLE